jgi:hypothetical protein
MRDVIADKQGVIKLTLMMNKGHSTDKDRETIKQIVTGMSNRQI